MVHKISKGERIDIDGKIIYVKDLTGNVGDTTYEEDPDNPGNYISVVNTTGYNGDRDSVALFLVAYIKTTTGNKFVTVKENNPLVVDEFEVVLGEDGWYNFHLIKVLAADSPLIEDYSEGSLVYDKTTLKLLKKSGGIFVEISDISSYIGTSYSVTTSEKPVVVTSSRVKTNLNLSITNSRFDEFCNARVIASLQDRYNKVRGILESAIYQYCIGNKLVFQKMMEYLNNNVLGEE